MVADSRKVCGFEDLVGDIVIVELAVCFSGLQDKMERGRIEERSGRDLEEVENL